MALKRGNARKVASSQSNQTKCDTHQYSISCLASVVAMEMMQVVLVSTWLFYEWIPFAANLQALHQGWHLTQKGQVASRTIFLTRSSHSKHSKRAIFSQTGLCSPSVIHWHHVLLFWVGFIRGYERVDGWRACMFACECVPMSTGVLEPCSLVVWVYMFHASAFLRPKE